jgi:hypothetical protein
MSGFETAPNPVSLGKITPAIGTPLSLISNFPTYTNLYANKICVSALPGNGGKIYLGYTGMNIVTMVGVLKIIEGGDTFAIDHSMGQNVFNVQEFYVATDNAGDGVIAFAHVM